MFIELTYYASNNRVLLDLDTGVRISEHYEPKAEEKHRNKIKIEDDRINYSNIFQESFDEIKAALEREKKIIYVPMIGR